MSKAKGTTKRRKGPLVRVLIFSCLLFCLALGSIYLLAAVYIGTPAAAKRVAAMLTDYLQYTVDIARLKLVGGTLYIEGLTVASPPGFTDPKFVSSRSIAITPDLFALLRGKKNFTGIAFRETSVTTTRNQQGTWNFDRLVTRFSQQKKGGGETFVKRLIVSHATVRIERFRLDNLELELDDFSTRGSADAGFIVTCKDVGGDLLRLQGKGRAGAVPAMDVAFSAPSVSLQSLAKSLGKQVGGGLETGRGDVLLTVQLRDRKVNVQGKAGLQHLQLGLDSGMLPVNAEIEFAGDYDIAEDLASLDAFSMRVNRLIALKASGKVHQVKTRKDFAAAVSLEPVDLEAVSAALPPELRRGFSARGVLTASRFRLAGDAPHGITSGKGSFSLRQGELTKGDTAFFTGLAGDGALVKVKEGWEIRGRLLQGRSPDATLVEKIDLPFTALLSNRLKPMTAEAPAFSALVSAFPLTGGITYRATSPAPLALRLALRTAPLSLLNRFAAPKGKFSAGTMDVALDAAGRGPGEFTGKLKVSSKGLGGAVAGRPVTVKEVVTNSDIAATGGKLSAAGHLQCTGMLVDAMPAAFSCSYRLTGKEFHLTGGTLNLARYRVSFDRADGLMPLPVGYNGSKRFPLHVQMNGITARSGTAGFDGGTGTIAADFFAVEGKPWLKGNAAITIPALTYNGIGIGSLGVGLTFGDQGGVAAIHGNLADGSITGTGQFDSLDPKKKSAFSIDLEGARLAKLGSFLPSSFPVKGKEGMVSVKLAGRYARGDGLQLRGEANGSDIALTGAGGKTLLEKGALRTACELARDHLAIREVSVSIGDMVTVQGRGEILKPFSSDRTGEVAVSLRTTPLDSLLTAAINSLPRGLQEATSTGMIGADGKMSVSHKQVLLEGRISLQKGGLEIPSQDVSVTGITGNIPFSLDVGAAVAEPRPEKRVFSRENYPSVLSSLQEAARSGQTCQIGSIRFGNMQFGATSLAFRASSGITELTSFKTSLFDGILLGEGFFRYGKQARYRANITISDLSLRTLCNAYPNIKGYISGRVDGIVSLYGEGTGINGLKGFVELWTLSAKGEKMLVSKEFLQKLAGQKFKSIFFRTDRPYDRGEIRGYLEKGYLTFDTLDISHTNLFGIRDLSVTVAPVQNRIGLGHLINSIKEAATRGKPAGGGGSSSPAETGEFKWQD